MALLPVASVPAAGRRRHFEILHHVEGVHDKEKNPRLAIGPTDSLFRLREHVSLKKPLRMERIAIGNQRRRLDLLVVSPLAYSLDLNTEDDGLRVSGGQTDFDVGCLPEGQGSTVERMSAATLRDDVDHAQLPELIQHSSHLPPVGCAASGVLENDVKLGIEFVFRYQWIDRQIVEHPSQIADGVARPVILLGR